MEGGEIDVIDTGTSAVATTIPTSVIGDPEDLVLNSSECWTPSPMRSPPP
jgi:hypothetical protein